MGDKPAFSVNNCVSDFGALHRENLDEFPDFEFFIKIPMFRELF